MKVRIIHDGGFSGTPVGEIVEAKSSVQGFFDITGEELTKACERQGLESYFTPKTHFTFYEEEVEIINEEELNHENAETT